MLCQGKTACQGLEPQNLWTGVLIMYISVPINQWMDKLNVVYPYNGILFTQTKEWSMVKPRFSTILVLEQLSSWPSCLWKKRLGCLTKLQVSFMLTPAWAVMNLSGDKQRRFSFWTSHVSNSFLERIQFENWGSTVWIHAAKQVSPEDIVLRSHTHSMATYDMIPFIRNAQHGQVYRHRKQITGYRGWGKGRGGVGGARGLTANR